MILYMKRIIILLSIIFSFLPFSYATNIYIEEENFREQLALDIFYNNSKNLKLLIDELSICAGEWCQRRKNSLKYFLSTNLEEKGIFYDSVYNSFKDLNWRSLPLELRILLYYYIRPTTGLNAMNIKSVDLEQKNIQDLLCDNISEAQPIVGELYSQFLEQCMGRQMFSSGPSTILPNTIKDIFYVDVDISHYKKGKFVQRPKLFMFCRQDRRYPCMMLMRDKSGKPLRLSNGELWHQPALGYSRKKKDYNQFDGNTPAGIFRIEGVMPQTNRKFAFGKYRRLIMDFIESSKNEMLMRSLLPLSSRQQNWWYESVVARNMGRSLFRIHGTGLKNLSKRRKYYPFVATRGCVTKREGKYGSIKYQDQNLLLNQLMKASDLKPVYGNHQKIRALFYIVEIDNKKQPVSMAELKSYGIH